MTERTLREKINDLMEVYDHTGGTAFVVKEHVLALLDAHTAAQPAPELCDVCGGHGMAGHPDSGAICLRCNGSGGIKPSPDAVTEADHVCLLNSDMRGHCMRCGQTIPKGAPTWE